MCIRDRVAAVLHGDDADGEAAHQTHGADGLAAQHQQDVYKRQAAYGSMPTHAASNQAIHQMYINGHFCYAYKFGIVTNGLGIVRDISFYNKDFLNAHPDMSNGTPPLILFGVRGIK